MKNIKICITVFLLGFCFGHVSGQYNDLPYRSWSSFKGDTLAYLKYNYGNAYTGDNTRKKSFVGKKVSDLFDELELPVTYVVYSVRRTGGNENGTCGIALGIHQLGVFPSELTDYYIQIKFTKLLSPEIKHQLNLSAGVPWTPHMYEAIKDVELLDVGFNLHIQFLEDPVLFKKGIENQRKFYEKHREELKGKKGDELVRKADEIRSREPRYIRN